MGVQRSTSKKYNIFCVFDWIFVHQLTLCSNRFSWTYGCIFSSLAVGSSTLFSVSMDAPAPHACKVPDIDGLLLSEEVANRPDAEVPSGTTIQYSCRLGYIMENGEQSASVACFNGRWSGRLSLCFGKMFGGSLSQMKKNKIESIYHLYCLETRSV